MNTIMSDENPVPVDTTEDVSVTENPGQEESTPAPQEENGGDAPPASDTLNVAV